MARPGSLPVVRVGVRARPLHDTYHYLMGISWRGLLAMITATYLAINLVFAAAYWALGPGAIEGAHGP